MTTGLVAILRGITPPEAEAIGRVLYGAGFRYVEVPLNSPDPLESIKLIRAALPEDCAVGAGTVLTVGQVELAKEAGSDIIVSPNMDQEVIRTTVGSGMRSYPGVATPSEAFAALAAGATALKLFPADSVGIGGMQAWRPVLPAGTEILPVGGISSSNLGEWVAAGAGGAGIGSTLYKPGRSAEDVGQRAAELMAAWRDATR
ncbi:2-dehydro-3-deoxy-6-phosphogalactonate aldolase [Sinomonas terrae]|uniref:2-dehydro-3-deoxy-6-phosphogalactonate aldolase n=1 Tax=Sinomonas terrae TaxID=2908838 RepID=A0ABS9U0P2_9MICC|nr:2-dehydro-3-deoxy-6-phosphogalactonate aldolase [Sinomonas terrae]MCH6470198.1 2-dehydro-3-deoxy-6-phosphogalactonate aldolase [Sinomonas terrae]